MSDTTWIDELEQGCKEAIALNNPAFYRADVVLRLIEMARRGEKYRDALQKAASMAGAPDATEACRNIIKLSNEALRDGVE